MKILITGGAGFIGSQIADRYLQLGHRVAIIDNLVTGRRENLPAEATFYEADIADRRAVETVFEAERPQLINHHAAQMDVRKSVADPQYDATINILGSLNLLQSAVKFRAEKFIFASTGGAIYGEQDFFPAHEDHPTRPLSPYGISKLTVEKYLFYYQRQFGLRYTILRYANVYGPRQNPHGEAGVVAIFTQKMLAGEQPLINGAGTQTRDYVFVGDVVAANELVITGGDNRIYNVGTSVETDVNTLLRRLIRLTGSSAAEQHGPAQPGEQLRSVLDSARIQEELGWRPEVQLEEGLRRTVEFFRRQLSIS